MTGGIKKNIYEPVDFVSEYLVVAGAEIKNSLK